MHISEPKVGAQYKLDGQVYEIISINDGCIAMCSLIHKYRRFLDHNLFATLEQRGQLILHQRAAIDTSPAAQLASLTGAQRSKFQHRLAYVQANLQQLGGRLPRIAAKAMIRQVAAKIGDDHPPGVTTLWQWKQRYLRSNHNPLALLRKPLRARRKRMAETTEELIRHYIKTVYLRRERPSLMHAYKLLRGHIAKENQERHHFDAPPISMPSYATFRRRVLCMDRYYVTREREGAKAAKRLNKFSGHLYVDDDPYACTLFDSQEMDVILVDSTGDPAGRPILSAHLVPADRECSGWDIAFGAPCAEKMMRATIRAIVKNGKMAGIVTDRGSEVLNTWAITTFESLGIDPDYVPVGDPDAKAIMERFFGTVNTGFCHNLPGTTKSSPRERGDYPSKLRACLTLEQFRNAFAQWLDVYHATRHDELHTSPAEKKAQLSALAPPAERYSEEELNQRCLSVWRLRIDGGRVTKSHLTWFGPGLPEVRQRLAPKQQALVYFNPCDLGTVWVAHPNTPQDWHPAIATRPDYQNGLSLSEHELVVEQLKAEKHRFDGDIACIKLYSLYEYIEACKHAHKGKAAAKHSKTRPAPIAPEDSSVQPGPDSLDSSDFLTYSLRSGDDDDSE